MFSTLLGIGQPMRRAIGAEQARIRQCAGVPAVGLHPAGPGRAMLSRFRAALREAYQRMRPLATGAGGSSGDRALAARIEKLRTRGRA